MINHYVCCSRCGMKHNNNKENLNLFFGLNRLGEDYKTCIKCRIFTPEQREKKLEQQRKCANTHYEHDKEFELQRKKQYREENTIT